MDYTKWVATWGNATSYIDQIATRYAKNLTLRYPFISCFDGDKIRIRFSNLTGDEEVSFTASIATSKNDKQIANDSYDLLLNGSKEIIIPPHSEITTDPLNLDIKAHQKYAVSLYFEKATQMNAGVLITGPLSKGFYSYGNYQKEEILPLNLTRNTNWFYFLNTIDIHTSANNHSFICYGDSITAQSWPDYLQLRLWENGIKNCSIIRRAVSGTRILREYDCITYKAYGLKGETRFPIEMNTSGASSVLIQHGINDIIHPVGEDVNIFRPMSDLPTVDEMIDAYKTIYIKHAKKLNYKVYGGTLLPIYGWRTYQDWRNDMKNSFNKELLALKEFDGIVDFDEVLRDPNKPEAFKEGFDSGDHLHPSDDAYKAMADSIPLNWFI